MCRFSALSPFFILVLWLCYDIQAANRHNANQESNRPLGGDQHSRKMFELSDIYAGWQQIASRNASLNATWERAVPSAIFSRLNAEAVVSARPEIASFRLHIKDDDFLFESARTAISDSQRFQGVVVSSPVSVYLPERGANPFFGQLYSRFQSPLPSVVWQRFTRQYYGGQLLDFWEPAGPHGASAYLRSFGDYGTSRWATLRIEQDDNEHCASLDLWSLLVALQPSSSLFNIRRENCKLDQEIVQVNGCDCYRVTEIASTGKVRRLWFVEAEAPFAVCRFIGEGEKDGVQIDLQWENLHGERQLVGWQYMIFPTAEAPTVYFGHSLLTSLQNVETNLPDRIEIEGFPVGTWVVDDVTGEEFILKEGNIKRVVEPSELSWLPLQQELQATDSGKVSALVERKIAFRKLLRGEVNVPVVLSVLFLAGIAVFYIGKYMVHGRTRQK